MSKKLDKNKERITIFAIGDNADYDSYKKFHREHKLLSEYNFDYTSTNYKRFLNGKAPKIKTEKVIIFLFFPFFYWNKYIEHKNYKGVYANRIFYTKFIRFWKIVDEKIKKNLTGKEIFFINDPSLCGLYRDKLVVRRKLARRNIPIPKLYTTSRVKDIKDMLKKGHNFFLKPRCGSMGKGITYLSCFDWQTNFAFKNNKIISRRSDRGWKFRDVTGNNIFLRKLLKKDITVEQAIETLVLKNKKIDFRMYTFFNKTLYVYPRRNKRDKITTNISQGGRGDPKLLEILPKRLISKARRMAEETSKALDLNFIGLDIIPDRNLKDMYVIDINVFAGFPKIKFFKLAQYMIKELALARKKRRLHFVKI